MNLSAKALEVIQRVAKIREAESHAMPMAEGITDAAAAPQAIRPPKENFKIRVSQGGPQVPNTLLHYRTTAIGDGLYQEALQTVMSTGAASTTVLQIRLGIGLGRAEELLIRMEFEGIIGPVGVDQYHKLLLHPMGDVS